MKAENGRLYSGECYSILLQLVRAAEIRIGRLGRHCFPEGYYLYTGRAKSGIAARIRRHRRKKKRRHWHIDYLTAHPDAVFQAFRIYPLPAERECEIHKSCSRLPGALLMIPGFGASDCRSRCGSHLLYFENRPDFPPRDVTFPVLP